MHNHKTHQSTRVEIQIIPSARECPRVRLAAVCGGRCDHRLARYLLADGWPVRGVVFEILSRVEYTAAKAPTGSQLIINVDSICLNQKNSARSRRMRGAECFLPPAATSASRARTRALIIARCINLSHRCGGAFGGALRCLQLRLNWVRRCTRCVGASGLGGAHKIVRTRAPPLRC